MYVDLKLPDKWSRLDSKNWMQVTFSGSCSECEAHRCISKWARVWKALPSKPHTQRSSLKVKGDLKVLNVKPLKVWSASCSNYWRLAQPEYWIFKVLKVKWRSTCRKAWIIPDERMNLWLCEADSPLAVERWIFWTQVSKAGIKVRNKHLKVQSTDSK